MFIERRIEQKLDAAGTADQRVGQGLRGVSGPAWRGPLSPADRRRRPPRRPGEARAAGSRTSEATSSRTRSRRPQSRSGRKRRASSRRPAAAPQRPSTTCFAFTTSAWSGANRSTATTRSWRRSSQGAAVKPQTDDGKIMRNFKARAWMRRVRLRARAHRDRGDSRLVVRPGAAGARAQRHRRLLRAAQSEQRSLAAGESDLDRQRPRVAGQAPASCAASRSFPATASSRSTPRPRMRRLK